MSFEIRALSSQTNFSYVTKKGVQGVKISKIIDGKERYVFFPSAGFCNIDSKNNIVYSSVGSYMRYMLSVGDYGQIDSMEASSGSPYIGVIGNLNNSVGTPIRGVFKTSEIPNDSGYTKHYGEGVWSVDLQLPSGIRWATCNVGATAETEYGDYYQWGAGSTTYQNTNQYYTSGTSSAYTLSIGNDTARQVMKWYWRMPSRANFQELFDNTISAWTAVNGVNGIKFSKTINGKERYVFFPASGYYKSGTLKENGSNCYFWTRKAYNSSAATAFHASNNTCNTSGYDRKYGFTIRGVIPYTED